MMENQDKFLEELYRRYFRYLVIHAYRYLGNWEDSNVAAQDAFIAIQEIIKEYQRQKTNQRSRKGGSARKPQQYHAEAEVII